MSSNKYGWWMIGGGNQQAAYGYGSEAEADAYRDYLNRGKEINLRHCEYLADDDDAATKMAGVSDITAEGIDLCEALAVINN